MSAEGSRSFVDTNVLVYAHDASAGTKLDRARGLVGDLWRSREGCVSVQVLQELFVTLTRRIATPLDSTTAATVVADYAKWTTHAPASGDVLAAIEIHERDGISFWDAMIARSAASLGCDLLYTEDLNAGQRYGGVLVVNPFAETDE
ncbi:MAG: PIN domain-containing protein [Gaiellaceae bacterium MAG52_C11]|nr:PIN domain-containing protein [Candidatus Gaiellasilicea maunaloa]